MGIFGSATQRHAEELVEQAYYETAATELASGDFNKGIYAKAISISDGDQSKIEPTYIKLRVNSLKIEASALSEIVASVETAKKEESVVPVDKEEEDGNFHFALMAIAFILFIFIAILLFALNR